MKKNILKLFSLIILISVIACNQDQSTTIYLVRHAEKMKEVKNPDLNELGIQRADNLAEILKDVKFTEIYSTDYKRTKQTAAPVIKQSEVELQLYDPREQEDFAEKLKWLKMGSNVLVVGHSNTIPMLVNFLIDSDDYSELSENEYDKLFVVTINKNGNTSVKMNLY